MSDGFAVIQSGMLQKSTSFHRWKLRYFVLRKNRRLEYWRDGRQTEMKGCINLKNCFRITDFEEGKGFGFGVYLPHRKYTLICDNNDERRTWINNLRDVCGLKRSGTNTADPTVIPKATKPSTAKGTTASSPSTTTTADADDTPEYFTDSDDDEDDSTEEVRSRVGTLTTDNGEGDAEGKGNGEGADDGDGNADESGEGGEKADKAAKAAKARARAQTGDNQGGIRKMEGNMFCNPLHANRTGNTRREFNAVLTNTMDKHEVEIKISPTEVTVVNKRTAKAMYTWKIDDIYFNQNKAVLSIEPSGTSEAVVFLVLDDENVADALASVQSSRSMRHASLSM